MMTEPDYDRKLSQPDYSKLDQAVKAVHSAFSAGVVAFAKGDDTEVKHQQQLLTKLLATLDQELDRMSARDRGKLSALSQHPNQLVATASRTTLNLLNGDFEGDGLASS